MLWLFSTIFLLSVHSCMCYGFDSGGDQGACGRQYRSARIHHPPCDLGGDGYCTSAGSDYPWHAVKRFVRENQGLMRRMYGDQRHGQVLKAELDEMEFNDIIFNKDNRKTHSRQDFNYNIDNDIFPRDSTEPRLLKEEKISNDDVLNTKFVYSEEPSMSIKVGDLKKAPYFRPTLAPTKEKNAKSTTASTESPTSTSKEDLTTETDIFTEPNVDTTTTSSVPNLTNIEVSSTTTSTTTENTSESTKAQAMLFQDMDEPNKDTIQINYQMRGVNACPVKEEVVAPFWANNTRGEVLALLNMYPFEQYVHWEKCTHEHKQMYCRDGCKCEQQYRLHRLLAYDPNNECRGIFSDWFRFPSCCLCKCYNIGTAEFRVTSRSPRANNDNENSFEGMPDWYRRKNEAIYAVNGDHG